jgi:Domain of unknown function (DUF4399)
MLSFSLKGVAMGMRAVLGVVMTTLTLAVAACGGRESAPAPSDTSAGASQGRARVFFVQPKNGDTIKSLSTVEFGSSGNVTVAAVPPGELTPDQVRAGMIHHHLGVDTDCLPPGVVIPKADPWIHFGDGKSVIEMSLAPGPHKLAVQAGDDMHRTIAGLCEVISVTVVE